MTEHEARSKQVKSIEDNKTEKFAALVVGIVIVVFIIAVTVYNLDDSRDIEYAKAGLEQCKLPDDTTSKVIWVKSCTEYLKTLKEVGLNE